MKRLLCLPFLITALTACTGAGMSMPDAANAVNPTATPTVTTESASPPPGDETPRPPETGASPATVTPRPRPFGNTAVPAPQPDLPTRAVAPSLPKGAPGTVLTHAPDRDLYRLASELIADLSPEAVRLVTPTPSRFDVGRVDTFWLMDLPTLQVYRSEFELRLVTDHAYWYVERGLDVLQGDLERSALVFEEDIHPRVTGAFGREWLPGVDNDPHLNILNANIKGVGGYYTSSDEHPPSVSPYSNQREIVYLNATVFRVGTPNYHRTLAHELQHAIHWNLDDSEETWVSEGLAELAVTVAGYTPDSIYRFLQAGPTSFVHWPLSSGGSVTNYGGASLFMHYLSEHYPTPGGLRPLLETPQDGIDGIDSYLQEAGYAVTFQEIFRDWAVANFLDHPQGPYGYSDLPVNVRVHRFVDDFAEIESEIPQYSIEYIELPGFSGPIRLRFQGQQETSLLGVDTGAQGCWWSNSGDSINSTLTRVVDLSGLDRATLTYQLWYNIEDKWDYAYLEVSLDGGTKWRILETPHTSAENPVGNSFGAGYTGDSGGWIDESVDLSEYTGEEILLRFQYVTDDALNGPGMCLRQVSVTERELTGSWQPEGFILIDNRVPQDYIVQVIEVSTNSRVREVLLDGDNAGELVVQAPQDLDRLVAVVAALAPKTRQPAPYSFTVEPVGEPSAP